MVGLSLNMPARLAGLGLALAALAACAGSPAPIQAGATRWGEPPVPSFSTPPRITDPTARLQCVPYARNASGIELYGDANTWWRQAQGRYARSQMPASGSVIVMRGYRTASRGHVAVVTDILSDRIIRVSHANWLNNGEVSVDVPVMDVSPENDWSQIRVWHVPGGHWGGRIYEVEGFIHAFGLRI